MNIILLLGVAFLGFFFIVENSSKKSANQRR